MVHLKIVLDTRRKKSDGTYPIVFRVTNVKKVHLIPAEISVKENDWDVNKLLLKNSHPNCSVINVKLSKRFYEIQKAILQINEVGEFCFEDLKSSLLPARSQPTLDTSFVNFANNVIDGFISIRRTGNALVYRTAVNRLIAYADNSNLEFKDIDYSFLDNFQIKLLQEGIKINTVGNYYRSIRALFNKAIKSKLIGRDLYPFNEISIKTEKTAKRAITIAELSKIYHHENIANSQEWHAANYFFLSFVLRGMSFTDMAYLTTSNIYKGYLTYKRRKTKKLYNIKLHPFANEIIELYHNNNNGYLIPIFPPGVSEDGVQAKKITRQWIKVTNKYLNRVALNCRVESHITTYVTRHTWATTAKKLGFSNELIAEAMGHEYGNKITNIYLDNFDQSLIDEMNDKVIESISK